MRWPTLTSEVATIDIRKTPHYLWELEGYLKSLGAIQTVPSKSQEPYKI